MKVFGNASFDGHENVVFCCSPAVGLKAIIAIHNTNLGPSLGGCRVRNYATEEEALQDVLRLSQGMTYKAALADLSLGGGKCVIIAEKTTPALFQELGRFVQSLAGRYITANDLGSSQEDMREVAKETSFVRGAQGTDPSLDTAYGVFKGMECAVQKRLGRSDLKGTKVALQGYGHAGHFLAKYLHEAGAQLWISDTNEAVLEDARHLATIVDNHSLYDLDVDVYAPCALGGTLNDDTIPRLKAKVVAGAANNQLENERHGVMLHEAGILYAPDYVINAGGVIHVFYKDDRTQVKPLVDKIPVTLGKIFDRSSTMPPSEVADRLARERFDKKR